MKMTNILLISALLLIANAAQVKYEFASFAEVSDISKSSYGKNLLDTIALSLKTGGDISSVSKLLDDLLFKLNKDQEAADAAWDKENARLKAKIKKLTQEIEHLEREILRLKAERARYLGLIVKVKANLKQYRSQLAADHAQIKSLNKIRGEDASDFRRSQGEHMDIINAISQVVKELRQLQGSISGKGKPKHVQEISQETRDRLNSSFLAIAKDDHEAMQFIQMATEADQKALGDLIKLLLKLQASAEKSFNDDKEAEKRSIATFNRLIEILKKDITKLTAMIVTSEKNLETYEKRVAKLTLEIETDEKIRKSKISERNATIKERETKENAYKEEKKERAEDMRIVRKLQHIVKTRLDNMTAYLKTQTGA